MEAFIENVKLWPCLWDTGHLLYRDISKKDLAWEKIAKDCRMVNGKEAKSQWKKLRDSHREALRRRKTSTGQSEMRPWKYEALMEFLLPQTESSSNHLKYLRSSISDAPNTNASVMLLEIPTNTSGITGNHLEVSCPPFIEPKENVTEIILQKFQEEKRELVDAEPGAIQDALSNLFTSFCQKTRALPKFLQLRVQREMFNVVSRAEEEAMSIDSYLAPSYPFEYEKSKNLNNKKKPIVDVSTTLVIQPMMKSEL